MLAILVWAALHVLVTLGMLAVGAGMVLDERRPTPAENARRYTQEDGTW